jgi:hypothetical protein
VLLWSAVLYVQDALSGHMQPSVAGTHGSVVGGPSCGVLRGLHAAHTWRLEQSRCRQAVLFAHRAGVTSTAPGCPQAWLQPG